MKRFWFMPLVAVSFLASCNEAKFTGTNPSNSVQNNIEFDAVCDFTPASLNVGESTTLQILLQGERPQNLLATLIQGDDTETRELTLNEGEVDSQTVAGKVAGQMLAEIRLAAGEDPVATCTAEVKEVVTPPQPSLACTLTDMPELGSLASIDVTVKNFDGPIYQRLVYAGNAAASTLITTGGAVTLENGDANTFSATTAGEARVELRFAADSEAPDATCSTTVIDPPSCEDDEESIGAHIAFLIDNSNSNAATDCPERTQIGTHKNVELFECGAKTNREKAVEAAFATLRAVREKEPENLDALSELAVVSFPTRADFINGYARETQWLAVEEANQTTLSIGLQFTRRPYGLTPYGAGFSGATELFVGLENTEKAKVAVLVTDGEPTDADPQGVLAQAQALKAQGVQVITVFVTGGETRAARRAKHTTMMQSIDTSSVNAGNGHWYADRYNSFDAYMAALIGNGATGGLVDEVSDEVVEVQNAEALTATFQSIIKTRAIRCEERSSAIGG